MAQAEKKPLLHQTNKTRSGTKKINKNKIKNNKKKKKNKNKLNILYTNINGVLGKSKSLYQSLISEEIHIATIAETKLDGPPPRIPNYTWITKNRPKAGGGVAILIRNDILPKTAAIDNIDQEDLESLWIRIKNPEKT